MKERNIFLTQIRNGFKELLINKWKCIFPLCYFTITAILWYSKIYIIPLTEKPPFTKVYYYAMAISFILLTIIIFLFMMSFIGTPRHIKSYHDRLLQIGFTNSIDEVPILLTIHKDNANRELSILTFGNRGIPLSKWEKSQEALETALGCQIAKITNGKTMRETILYTVPYQTSTPHKLLWKDSFLSQAPATLVLGKNLAGELQILQLSKTHHVLIGGSTGSGKSALLRLMIKQCIMKHAQVYIVDLKGVDFGEFRQSCTLVYYENEVLALTDYLINELNKRRELFHNTGFSDIDTYNAQTEAKIKRIILVFDEFAELFDRTAASKERKEMISAIESALSTLARQGRAFGLHLMLSTQRPSADILSGQIKNNMDYRICGKADNVLSQIILDNTSASTKIPKESQGLFTTHSGEVFQAFWYDEKQTIL